MTTQHTDEMRKQFIAAYKNETGQAPVEWESEFNSPSVKTAWALYQAATLSAEAKYLPVIEKLVEVLTSAPLESPSGFWLGKYNHALALAAPLLKEDK